MSSAHDHRLLVLSNAAPGRDEEFNTWYDAHVPHVLEVPGIDAAHRLRFSADQFPADVMPPSPHTYISIYEVSRDPADIITALLAPEFAEGLPDAFDTASERASSASVRRWRTLTTSCWCFPTPQPRPSTAS
jgi:hypothetical protein